MFAETLYLGHMGKPNIQDAQMQMIYSIDEERRRCNGDPPYMNESESAHFAESLVCTEGTCAVLALTMPTGPCSLLAEQHSFAV